MERWIVLGFLSVILTGTLLLWGNSGPVRPISLLDALFLSASAVCVTGLSPLDVGRALSPSSQVLLLLLIQLGGLGVMTVTTALPLLMGQRIGLRGRILFSGGLGIDSLQGAVRLLRRVLLFTLLIEGGGAFLLFWGFLPGRGVGEAAWLALFHSVSAFCNAGFSPFSDSLESFSGAFLVPGTLMGLILLGGIGFPVLSELVARRSRPGTPLSPYARIVLRTTGLLLLGGTVLLASTEWNRAFAGFSPGLKLWNALFASVTPRTAGFDTVSYANFSGAGIAITILLMIIGASPSSTGGGIKTTTLAVLCRMAWADLTRKGEVELFARRVEFDTIRRAWALTLIYVWTLFAAAIVLSFLEPFPFAELLFECVSAMGTVGLSMGITGKLTPESKLVLVCLMFWGRVGIVTFFYGVLSRGASAGGRVTLPSARVPIG